MASKTPLLRHPQARFYQPKHLPQIPLDHVDVLSIGAHQDDDIILAPKYAYDAYATGVRNYCAITVANGAGKKPRSPRLQHLSARAMCSLRNKEMMTAADTGEYAGCFMLCHPSDAMRNCRNGELIEELREILLATSPTTVITHNPIDLHTTHVGVYYHVAWAIRSLPESKRPKYFYGSEGWGDISRWHVALNGKAGTKLFDTTNCLEYVTRVLGPYVSQNDIMGYNTRIPMMFRLRAGLMDPYENTGMTAVQLAFDMAQVLNCELSPGDYCKHLLAMHDRHMAQMHAGYEE